MRKFVTLVATAAFLSVAPIAYAENYYPPARRAPPVFQAAPPTAPPTEIERDGARAEINDLTSQISLIISTVSALLAAAAIIISIYIGRITVNSTNRDTVMSAIIDCNNRYEDLYIYRDEIEKEYHENPSFIDSKVYQDRVESYFRRYWALKSDQIDYWILGYVDSDTLLTWIYSMFNMFIGEKTVGGTSYRASWTKAYLDHKDLNPTMSRVIDSVVAAADSSQRDREETNFAKIFAIMLEVESKRARVFKAMRADNRSFKKLKKIHSLEVRRKISEEQRKIKGDVRH